MPAPQGLQNSEEIFIVHLFPVCGGAERLSLEVARALLEHGIRVTYVTNSGKTLRVCGEMFNVSANYDIIEVRSISESLLTVTKRFTRVRTLTLLRKIYKIARSLKDRGLVIDTGTNYANGLHVNYIHYPAILDMLYRDSRRIYRKLYDKFVEILIKGIKERPLLIMTNSRWTAELIRKVYGLNAFIVHPPVDVDYFKYNDEEKVKTIVTVSRLTPEKNLHVIPRIARRLPEYTWYIVGSRWVDTGRSVSENVISQIKNEAKSLGAHNVQVLPDLPRSNLKKILLEAMFYIHPPYPEHFGIAVAEAMAAGAIPIVYRDGGAWSDIVSPVSERLGYRDIEEIPQIVRSIEESESLMNTLRERAIARANEFRPEIFRERFIELLKQHNLI